MMITESMFLERISIGRESFGKEPLWPKPWVAYIWWKYKKTGHRRLEQYSGAELLAKLSVCDHTGGYAAILQAALKKLIG